MDTDERARADSKVDSGSVAAVRWRTLSEHLADEVDAARADAARAGDERERALARLRDLHARYTEIQLVSWLSERDRQNLDLRLAQASDHIARTQPLLRSMRSVLKLVQDSKFWKLRNAWFRLKQRIRQNAAGPQPYFVPDLDDTDDRWMRQLPYERWKLAHRFRDSDRRRLKEMVGVCCRCGRRSAC